MKGRGLYSLRIAPHQTSRNHRKEHVIICAKAVKRNETSFVERKCYM